MRVVPVGLSVVKVNGKARNSKERAAGKIIEMSGTEYHFITIDNGIFIH